MKYNDKEARNFHIRSANRDPFYRSDRQRRRESYRLLQRQIKSVSTHYLCEVMSKEELIDLYNDYRHNTGSSWSTYFEFSGTYSEFIDYLIKRGDKRVSNILARYRNRNINTILSDI